MTMEQVTPEGRGLGRLEAPDERDNRFPMSLALEPVPLPVYKYYLPGVCLNQGSKPQCVAYAWKQWLQTNPIRQGATKSEQKLYDAAQQIDEWEGPPPDYAGTSVRAGAKVLQAEAFIGSYLWATDIDMLKTWILTKSPVVVGTLWYHSMSQPSITTGLAKVDQNSGIAGGHAYIILGYSSTRRQFRCMNSWGIAYGHQGKFWIGEDDMAFLLYQKGGEAVTAIEKRVIV